MGNLLGQGRNSIAHVPQYVFLISALPTVRRRYRIPSWRTAISYGRCGIVRVTELKKIYLEDPAPDAGGQVLRPAHASKEPFRMCQKLHGGSHAALHFLLLSSCAYCIKVLYKNKLAYKYFHILFSVIESVGKGKYSGEGWEKVKGVKVRVLYKRKLL